MSDEPRATPAHTFQAWTSFLVAFTLSLYGIGALPLDPWMRGFLAVAFLFTVTSAFTLAKTLRDQHEGRRLLNRIEEARTEQILKRYAGEPE